MNYSLYLFDFDYTLANSEKGIVSCFQYVLSNHGFLSIPNETIKRTIGLTLEEAFQLLTGITDPLCIIELKKEYVARADQIMTQNTFLYPDVPDTLRSLKGQNKLLGIISTKYRYRIEETLSQYGISELFSIILGGEDVSHHKPDPEGIYLAAHRLGIPKENILYIGDSIVDAKTAHHAGVAFTAVTTGATPKEEFLAYPHLEIIKSLSQLLK